MRVKSQTLLNYLPVAILLTDKEGQIHYSNQEADILFNDHVLVRHELTHYKLTKLANNFTAHDLTHALNHLNNSQFSSPFIQKITLGQQNNSHYQLKIIKNPGNDTDSFFLITLLPLFDSAVNSHQMNNIKKNFKELKQVSRLSAMREISSSLADQLNQPLTAILSYTQAMQRLYKNKAPSEDIRHAMTRVVINAENAGKIIRKIRSQLKVNTLTYQNTCINDLIQESIYLTELDSLPIKLKRNYEMQFTSICIDNRQIRQVIFSLLNNAIDALSSASINTPEIIIKTEKQSSHYKITISDNGPGLPDEIKDTLFEPFNTTKKNSLGIGLSVCRHIIELHKGEIMIQSDTQDTTRITILLPLITDNDYCLLPTKT